MITLTCITLKLVISTTFLICGGDEMIKKLEIRNLDMRIKIEKLQKESYLVEARLINYFKIPGLIEDEKKLVESQEIFYGYIIDDQLLGIISYKLLNNIIDIHRLAILPNHFNKGIATSLIKNIEKLEIKTQKIIVSTGKKNYPACKLYEKLGYIKINETIIEDNLIINNYEKIL